WLVDSRLIEIHASTTVSGSHSPLVTWYTALPLYVALNEYRPAAAVCANALTSTVPFTSGVTADVAAAAPVHDAVVNHTTVAVPLGVGLPAAPPTTTESCAASSAAMPVTT